MLGWLFGSSVTNEAREEGNKIADVYVSQSEREGTITTEERRSMDNMSQDDYIEAMDDLGYELKYSGWRGYYWVKVGE